jgi:hypothetical protein
MSRPLQIINVVVGLFALGGFAAAFLANFFLAPYFKARPNMSWFTRFQMAGNPVTPCESYREDGAIFWRIRNRGLKVFAIGTGLLVINAVVAAIVGN